jgi:hypothetical protein
MKQEFIIPEDRRIFLLRVIVPGFQRVVSTMDKIYREVLGSASIKLKHSIFVQGEN